MSDERMDSRVEVILASGLPPEAVCGDDLELLSAVRSRLAAVRAVEGDLDAIFPDPLASRIDEGPGVRPSIPGYDVQAVLGRGGMGVVFRARQHSLSRPVALKMMLADAYASGSEVQRFLREADALSQIRHPNIVAVHDAGESAGRPFYSMELVEGGTLAQKLAGQPQPIRASVEMVAVLANAVHAAHEAGIVHRDLKPANVLLTPDGTPKVADFGLAKRIAPGQSLTGSGVSLGTPGYMAPEQVRGSPDVVGTAVDVYALGAILYEMLTGRPPFRSESPAATHMQVLEQDPVPPSQLNSRVPRDVETICLTCLRKEPERRYGSAALLAADLGRYQRGETIAARPAGRVEKLRKWVARNPAGAAFVVTAAVLLVLAVAAGLREVSLAARERAEAEKWAERLEFAHKMQREGRFPEARAILWRFPDGGSADLRRRIGRAQAELELLERLDAIRHAGGPWMGLDQQAARAYEQAFAEAGMDLFDEPPAAIAEKIAASDSRHGLVAALDDWALSLEGEDLSRVYEVARLADPEPWRDRVRVAVAQQDAEAIDALAAEASMDGQPVPVLLSVGLSLLRAGRDGTGFVKRVHFAHPDDFWVNIALSYMLRFDDEAVGYSRAALAVRPRAVLAMSSLASALAQQGRSEEAHRYWRRALEIEPDSTLVRINWAVDALNGGRVDEAAALAKEVIDLDPSYFQGYSVLGHALLRQQRFEEAVVALGEAVARMPPEDP
ncbi:MAG: protein kinase, partial [Planctomycetota bacterium JB042]